MFLPLPDWIRMASPCPTSMKWTLACFFPVSFMTMARLRKADSCPFVIVSFGLYVPSVLPTVMFAWMMRLIYGYAFIEGLRSLKDLVDSVVKLKARAMKMARSEERRVGKKSE